MTDETSLPGRERDPAPTCAECGTRAEPGQPFCDACGAVLGWSGVSAAAATVRPGTPRTGDAAGDAAGGAAEDGPRAAGGQYGRSGEPSVAGSGREQDEAARRPDDGNGGGAHGAAGGGAGGRAGGQETALGSATAGRLNPGSHGTAATTRAPLPRQDRPATGYDTREAGTARTQAATGDSASSHPAAGTNVPTPQPPAEAGTGYGAPAGAPAGAPTDDTAATEPLRSPSADSHGSPGSPSPSDPALSPSPGGQSATDRARSLLVPVADPEPRAPAEPSVVPVLPGRPVDNRPRVRTPGAESGAEGGVACPWCETPNRTDRHFCCRCAMPMSGAPQAPGRLVWWRRLLDFRNREAPWAGDRPRLRHGLGRILSWVVGALVLALVVTAALNTGKAIQAVRDHFTKPVPVNANHYAASRSFSGHGASLAFDAYNNTWWGSGLSQSDEGQWLEARFDQPTDLLDLMITPGVSAQAAQLTKEALPHRIEATITSDGKTTTQSFNLGYRAGGQTIQFRHRQVTAVRFTLQGSAYGATDQKQVAIAAIEFFGPPNSSD